MAVELATAYVTLKVNGSQVAPGVRRSMAGAEGIAAQAGARSGKAFGRGFGKNTISTEKALGRIGKVSGRVFLAGAAGIAYAEKKAADFNAQMATVYTLSHANTRQQGLLAKAAKTVGVNIGYSATQSAQAEEELIKAGVSVQKILGGGLKGALDLAAAGQTDVATATEVAASAMTQFSLKGKDVPHIADLLAAGADKALGSVTDLGYGLAQVGTVAHQMGFSIEATTGTLAEFAQNGLLGEKGGAALKQMFLRLANPTKKSQELMTEYGLSLYKANGQIKTLPELAGNLQKSFEHLTPAQRNAALGTIFGSRAIQAANILVKDGERGNRKWIKSVDDQGFAAHQAAGKMNSLKGDVQKLKAQFDNAFINASGKQNFLRGLVQDGTHLIKVYNNLTGAQRHFLNTSIVKGTEIAGAVWAATKIYKLAKSTSELYGWATGRGAARVLGRGVAGGALGGAARGVTPVFVTNWGKGGVHLPGGKTSKAANAAENAAGGALGSKAAQAGETAGAAWLLTKLGKAAPDLGKVWAKFQEDAALKSVVGSGSKLLGRAGGLAAGVTLGSAGNETRKGFKSADQLSPAQIATLSKAQKEMLNLSYAETQAAKGQKAVSHEFDAAYTLMSKVNPSIGKYAKTLDTIPKEIRSYVSTPGAALSVASMGRLRTEYKLTPKQVRTVMQLQGFNETQIRIVNAGKAYRSLPKDVKTAIHTPGAVQSKADVLRLQRQFHLTPKQVATVMHVSGVDDAIAKVRRLRIEIAGVRSKSVTIQEVVRRSKGHAGSGAYSTYISASGGTVPGQRRPYGDKVHSFLAPGEEVISNRYGQADRNRALLKAINANRYANGGTVGRASPPVAVGQGGGSATLHLYDTDGVLLGTMEGVADQRIYANGALPR